MRKPYVILELVDQGNLPPMDMEGIRFGLNSNQAIKSFLLCDETQAKEETRKMAAKQPHKLFALMAPIFVAEVTKVPVVEKEFNQEGELIITKGER